MTDEPYESFVQILEDTGISKDELLYLCLINERIISYASKYLDNPMLESIISFFKIHNQEYAQNYAKYTNLDREDIKNGVVDQLWFNNIKNNIGTKEFEYIKNLKKNDSANLIFDALNNKLKKKEVLENIKNIKNKKNKKNYLKAYSSLNPSKYPY